MKIRRIGRKGIGPILLVLIIAFGSIGIEAVYAAFGINYNIVTDQIDREVKVISGINSMEFLKLSMQEAVGYAFNQAAYDTLKQGGYYEFSASVPINAGLPYWINYSDTYVPKIEANLTNSTLELFDKYVNSYVQKYGSELGITLDKPNYYGGCGGLAMAANARSIKLSINDTCKYGLHARGQSFTISESNANFSDTLDSNALQLFETAKSKFVDVTKDPVLDAVEQAIGDMPSAQPTDWDTQLKQKITAKLNAENSSINSQLSGMSVSFIFSDSNISVSYCSGCTTKYQANALVKISMHGTINADNCQPIYDINHANNCVSSSNDLDWRYLSLEFYIRDGNWKG